MWAHSCPRQNGVACLANFLYVSFFHAISNQNLKDILATKPTVKKNLRNVSANGLDFVICVNNVKRYVRSFVVLRT